MFIPWTVITDVLEGAIKEKQIKHNDLILQMWLLKYVEDKWNMFYSYTIKNYISYINNTFISVGKKIILYFSLIKDAVALINFGKFCSKS